MDLSNPNDPLLRATIASVITVITLIIALMEEEDNDQRGIAREPSTIREQWRKAHMYRILTGSGNNYVHYLRMSSGPFYRLVNTFRENGSLKDHAPNQTAPITSFMSFISIDDYQISPTQVL